MSTPASHNSISSVVKDCPPEERSRRAAHGGLWTAIGTGLFSLLQFIALVVLARYLSPSDFGISSACLVIVAFAQTVAISGVGPALVQKRHVTAEHLACAFGSSVAVGSLFTIFTYAGAGSISSIFRIEELGSALRVMSIGFLIQSLGIVSEHLLARELQFRKLAVIDVASYALGYLAVALWCALNQLGYWSLVIAYLCHTTLRTAGLLAMRPHSMAVRFGQAAFRETWYLGAGFSLSQLFNFVALNIDNVVVGRALGADALGIYSRAFQLMAVPSRIYSQVVDRVMFPVMARANAEGTFGRVHEAAIRISSMFGLPASIVLFICSDELVSVLFGERWSGITDVFAILAIAMYCRIGLKVTGTVLKSAGAVYVSSWVQALYAAAILIGAVVGTLAGLRGVAIGIATAVTVHYCVSSVVALRCSRLGVRSFLVAHRAGAFLALLILVTYYGLRLLLSAAQMDAGSLLSLVGSAVLSVGVVCLCPSVFLDRWVLNVARRAIHRSAGA